MNEDIKTFKRGKRVQITDHFASTEMDCKCADPKCVETPISMQTMNVLEEIRKETGSVLHITSGYRCPVKNKAVGGAKASQHLLGMAADIVSRTHSPKQVQAIAKKAMDKVLGKEVGGLGTYSSFTHVDSRAKRTYWKG